MSIILEQLDKMTEALTIPEVAAMFHKDKRTIYRHAQSGKLPSFRFFGSVLVDPAVLAAFMRATTRLGIPMFV
jgi:hypothetical protein